VNNYLKTRGHRIITVVMEGLSVFTIFCTIRLLSTMSAEGYEVIKIYGETVPIYSFAQSLLGALVCSALCVLINMFIRFLSGIVQLRLTVAKCLNSMGDLLFIPLFLAALQLSYDYFWFQQYPLFFTDGASAEQDTAHLMYILATTVMFVVFFSRHVLIYSQFIRHRLQTKNRVYPSCLLVSIVLLIQTGEFLCLGLPSALTIVIFNFQLSLASIDRTNRYQASIIGSIIAAWLALLCNIFHLSIVPSTESFWSYYLLQQTRRQPVAQTSETGRGTKQLVLSSSTLPPFIAIDDEDVQLPPLIVVDEAPGQGNPKVVDFQPL